MKTKEENERRAGMTTRAAAAVALAAVAFAATGCSVIESIDRKLASWGVVDASFGAGIDVLAVVEVCSGNSRGVGVVLDNGLVFTADHVVKNRERVVVRTMGYYNDSYFQTLSARVVFRNSSGDQALLSVEGGETIAHSVELGRSAAGPATVLPLRASGASSTGALVKSAVARPVEVTGARGRFTGNAGLARGDSGAPIVQNGRVVGLVRADGRMIGSDVLENYRIVKEADGRRMNGAAPAGKSADEIAAPQCSRPCADAARS